MILNQRKDTKEVSTSFMRTLKILPIFMQEWDLTILMRKFLTWKSTKLLINFGLISTKSKGKKWRKEDRFNLLLELIRLSHLDTTLSIELWLLNWWKERKTISPFFMDLDLILSSNTLDQARRKLSRQGQLPAITIWYSNGRARKWI